jgi:hypothetical protein
VISPANCRTDARGAAPRKAAGRKTRRRLATGHGGNPAASDTHRARAQDTRAPLARAADRSDLIKPEIKTEATGPVKT